MDEILLILTPWLLAAFLILLQIAGCASPTYEDQLYKTVIAVEGAR